MGPRRGVGTEGNANGTRASAAGLKQADDYAAMLEAGDRLMVALVGPTPSKT